MQLQAIVCVRRITFTCCHLFTHLGDVAEFNKLLPDVEAVLDDQISIFDQCLLTSASAKVMTRERCNYEFIGWDDRTGIGGANPMAADGEPYRVYNSLVTRAVRELATALNATGAIAKIFVVVGVD